MGGSLEGGGWMDTSNAGLKGGAEGGGVNTEGYARRGIIFMRQDIDIFN